jgi:hypothetical protein
MEARKGTGRPPGQRSLHVVRAGPDEPIELSVIIPAFNEGARIGRGLDELSASIDRGALGQGAVEVLVVDDGSTDDTCAEVERKLPSLAHLQVIRLPKNMGKGAAVRAGVAAATGAIVAFMDADMAVHPSTLSPLLGALSESGMAIGSRALPGSSTEDTSLDRVVLGRTFNRIVSVLTGLPIRDTQCGFKALRAPIARMLFHYSQVDRYAFDVDLLVIARFFGITVAEVPVHWRHVVGSHIRPLSDPLRMAGDVLSLRWTRRKPIPMSAVAITGSQVSSALADATRGVVGPTLPIASWDGHGLLVLFPMCHPLDVEHRLRLLEQRLTTSTLHQISLTMAEVAPLIPSLIPAHAADAPTLPIAGPGLVETGNESAQPEPGGR